MDAGRAFLGRREPKPLRCDPSKYGAAAARYVDAFMHNVNWEEVDRRTEPALRLSGATA